MVKQLIYLFLFLALCLESTDLYAQEDKQQKIDSILKLLPHAKEDQGKLKMYLGLLWLHQYGDYEKGLSYAEPCIKLADQLKNPRGMILARLYTGRLHWRATRFTEAIRYHEEARKLAERYHDRHLLFEAITFLGQDYADNHDYPMALQYFNQLEQMAEKDKGKNQLSTVYSLISWVYSQQGNYPKSAEYNLKFVRLAHGNGDVSSEAVGLSNLAGDYLSIGKDSLALRYYDSAAKLQQHTDRTNYCISLRGMGDIYLKLHEYQKALTYYELGLRTAKEIPEIAEIIAVYIQIARLFDEQANHAKALEYYLMAWRTIQQHNDKKLKANLYINLARCYLKQQQVSPATRFLDTVNMISKEVQSESLDANYLQVRELLDSVRGNWKDAYLYFKKFVRLRDKLYSDANTKQIMQVSMQYEFDKKQAELKALQEKKDTRQRTIRNSIAVALLATLLFLGVVYRQRNRINKEKNRSNELLLNILPEEVADELKEKGSTDARYFNMVTVMFTDFKDFTRITEKLSPAELVAEIHHCFKAFDEIITSYNIEKIKTIGDSYMCAGGLPVSNDTHSLDVVRAALAIQQFMQEHAKKRQLAGKEAFEIRIGVHTGPVVAGIVGVKKFAYDIWGDTVNLASRMESSGEAGKVNISGSTYESVKDVFPCTYRGKIEAKGKGQIDMYFVDQVADAT